MKIFIRILSHRFLGDFGPKWSGKVPNGVIMGGDYSQRPYGGFWTVSGTFVGAKTTTIMNTSRSRKTDCLDIENPKILPC